MLFKTSDFNQMDHTNEQVGRISEEDRNTLIKGTSLEAGGWVT